MVRHHCLYGNELADSEDVRWWLKQRQGAPLDHQAGIERLPFDSVGCMRVDRTAKRSRKYHETTLDICEFTIIEYVSVVYVHYYTK